jgi:fatty acid desaturase
MSKHSAVIYGLLLYLFQDDTDEMAFRTKVMLAAVGFVLGEVFVIMIFFFLFNKILVSRWNHTPSDASSLAISLAAFFSLILVLALIFYLDFLALFVLYSVMGFLFFLWFIHFLFTYLLRRSR